MYSPTGMERRLISVIRQEAPAPRRYAHKLYFHLNRVGVVSATGSRENMTCSVGKHKTKQDTYTATEIVNLLLGQFQTIRTCLEHVPNGSWLEGRDKPTREPEP